MEEKWSKNEENGIKVRKNEGKMESRGEKNGIKNWNKDEKKKKKREKTEKNKRKRGKKSSERRQNESKVRGKKGPTAHCVVTAEANNGAAAARGSVHAAPMAKRLGVCVAAAWFWAEKGRFWGAEVSMGRAAVAYLCLLTNSGFVCCRCERQRHFAMLRLYPQLLGSKKGRKGEKNKKKEI